MGKLWNYEDYVSHLTHKNDLVKRWAFHALDNRYINRFTDEIHLLLDSDNEHLVLGALRYLEYHKAVQYAPKILELINHSNGLISSNSITALADLKYEPAFESILSKLYDEHTDDDLLSVTQYFGVIRNEESRSVLQAAVVKIKDEFNLGSPISSLLKHHHPEDIDIVMERICESIDRLKFDNMLLTYLVEGVGGKAYFQEMTVNYRDDISKEPDKSLENLLNYNTHIDFDPELREKIINVIKNDQYKDLATIIMFASKDIINSRYPDEPLNDALKELKEQDQMSLALLEDISKRSIIWENISKDSKSNLCDNIISTIISIYCGILERGNYVEVLYQDCTDKDQLIGSLKKAGPSVPQRIKDAITVSLSPSDIKGVLTEDLNTWADIWSVRLMKRMGNKEFVPDLLRVLKTADSLDYIYNDAIFSLAALEESADAELLDAINSSDLDEWEKFLVLDYLPYSEAYDVAVQLWDSGSDEMDSYDIFATTLENIGDKRGIKKLRDIFDTENNSLDIWESIECLAEIHQVDIPEPADVQRMREEREERHKTGMMELKQIAENYEKRQEQLKQDVFEEDAFKEEPKIETYKRSTPKIGRNDPCPCGSGKKYKKCCLK